MISVAEELEKKKCDAASAVSRSIKSGDQVILGHCAGVPLALTDELVNQKDRLSHVKIFHMVPLHSCDYCAPEYEGIFRHVTTFVGKPTRTAVNEGRGDFIPCFFSQLPSCIREGSISCDVAFVSLTPPDEHGYMSLGVSVDYTLEAIKKARTVVAEINDQMPRTYGTFIHISEVNYIVPVSYPIPEVPNPVISEVEEKIGQYIASLIEDGSNLQLGIGAIPDAVLQFLKEKKNLGIHSEMFSDGVVDLFHAGAVTNTNNTVNPGKFVATFLMGTKKLYDFVDNNPAVMMAPVDYTNNTLIAAQVEKLISINSAIEVDIMGQVCAEMIGGTQFSAVGGQVDFVRAASISPGGKSIIAFPSTTRKGTISRIVMKLSDGAAVTTSRNDVDYIVTEWGIARLKGKSLHDRAIALIQIAHPDFREDMIHSCTKEGIFHESV